MPPLPKDPALKQRRNKTATRAVLPAEDSPITRRPVMPDHPKGDEWHAMAERFWRDVWHSPMSDEYLRADVHGLFVMVVLIDQFWKRPNVNLSREIRQLGQNYGLSPIDRRRLEWSVERTEQAKDKRDRERAKNAVVVADSDPREALE